MDFYLQIYIDCTRKITFKIIEIIELRKKVSQDYLVENNTYYSQT